MATITTMINESRAGVAAEPLLRFLIRIALALLTTLAKKRSIGPYTQFENSTSYTTRHEYQGGLWVLGRRPVHALIRTLRVGCRRSTEFANHRYLSLAPRGFLPRFWDDARFMIFLLLRPLRRRVTH